MASICEHEAFRQADEEGAGFCAPLDAAVVEDFHDAAVEGTFEGFYLVAGLETGGLPERIDGCAHGVTVKNAGDVVRNGGDEFTTAHGWQFSEDEVCDAAGDICKSIPVEKQEGGTPVAGFQEIERFLQRQDF